MDFEIWRLVQQAAQGPGTRRGAREPRSDALLSFHRLLQVNPGFAVDRVLTFRINAPEDKYQTDEQQSWFIRLGRGTAVRALNLPLVLTRSMEHYVRQAPDHYTAMQALRYGETRGRGGSEELAREIAIGSLGQRIEHAEFWRTVLRFFVAHTNMKLEHVNPIVDFIHANKFAGDEVLTEGGTETRNPPWSDFSMKGRTLKSILRLASAWHSNLAANNPTNAFPGENRVSKDIGFW